MPQPICHVVVCVPQVFQDVLGIENFTKSEEAFAADALFAAYSAGAAEKVQAVVQVRAQQYNKQHMAQGLALQAAGQGAGAAHSAC